MTEDRSLSGIPEAWQARRFSIFILITLIIACSAFSIAIDAQSQVATDRTRYLLGERVHIHLAEPSLGKELYIVLGDIAYKYASTLSSDIEFTPLAQGNYTIRLGDNDSTIHTYQFTVVSEEDGSSEASGAKEETPAAGLGDSAANDPVGIWVEKDTFSLGEAVSIRLAGNVEKLMIVYGEETRSYLGKVGSEITFTPREGGQYKIVAVLSDGSQLEKDFSVIGTKASQENPQELTDSGLKLPTPAEVIERLIDMNPFKSKREYVRLEGKGGAELLYESKVTNDEPGMVDMELRLNSSPVKSIKFVGLKKEGTPPQIRLSEVQGDIPELRLKNVRKAFAIDPSAAEFGAASVSAVATGTDLYKCKDWDYDSSTCRGNWSWVMDLIPGKEYSFELGPADPGFAETGVATANTNKPTYHPGEEANITLVTLDNEGYLTDDAYLTLRISTPSGSILSFNNSGGGLSRSERGIYNLLFSQTAEEGYYWFEVSASGQNINYTLLSYFQVASFYDFDIIRQMPTTLDPWEEPLNSSISITPYIDVAGYNFSEPLPYEFSVEDAGGAVETMVGGRKVLTWSGLDNSTVVSYVARPPYLSPTLYEIGPSYVTYRNQTYFEARLWYLAIDPSPESLYIDSGQWSPPGGATLTASELVALNGSGGAGLLLDANGEDDFTGTVRNPTPNGTIETITQVHIIVVWSDIGGVDANEITVEGRDGSYTGTLFCSGTNAAGGGGTITVDCDAAHTFTAAELNNLNVNVISTATGNEDANVTYVHVDVTYTEYNPPPNVTLVAPVDLEWKTTRNVNFTYNVTSSDGIKNCSLWTNEGSWGYKEVNKTAITLGGINGINDTFSSDGNYLWNILCFDPSGSGGFAQSNRTVRIDTTPPTVNLTKPAANYWNDSSNPMTVTFNCSITDNVNSTNLSLYITNSQNTSFSYSDYCTITAQNGSCQWAKSLSNGNYTWNCLGVDHLGWSSWGTANRTVKINSTISAPRIWDVQCLNSSSLWEPCYNILFNDTLREVRVNCTDLDGSIANATFNLMNLPDSRQYFSGNATSTSGGWWYYNNTDFAINDSGDFRLIVACRDDMGLITSNQTDWLVPWGRIVASLVSPSTNTNVYQNQTFNFISQVSCVEGECGDVTATLDPINTYSASSSGLAVLLVGDAPPVANAGSYTSTATADCSGGTCTDTNSWIVGPYDIGNNEPYTGEMNATLSFNVSGINPYHIKNLTLTWSGCWHGDQITGNNHCNNANNPEFKSGSGGGNFTMYIFNGSEYVQLDCINNVNGECEADDFIRLGTYTSAPSWGNADGYNTFKFERSIFNSSFVNNGLITIMWRTTGALVWADGNSEDDILMIIDYAKIDLGWEYPAKNGAVSMAAGAEPFYTTSANPMTLLNQSCLGNMMAGQSCQVSWLVNATGGINTVHNFYVVYNMTTNTAYVQNNETKRINLTITVPPTDQPPNVTLIYPAQNNISSVPDMVFNCSATDDMGLYNMTLYANFSGSFAPNGTNSISGLNTSTTFSRTLADGIYVWNCLAYDNAGHSDWGDSNRTLTVDSTKPNIVLNQPADNENFTVSTIWFNFSVYDALDNILVCNITLNGQVRDSSFNAQSGNITLRNISNIVQGYYYWNVSCVDNAGNRNTSQTWRFNVTDVMPSVALVTGDNVSQQSSTILLQYNATDNNGVTEASLYINGVLNSTNDTVGNGAISNFTVTGLAEGRYNWTVNVSDISNLSAQALVKWFTIDWTKPSIMLIAPQMPFSTTNSTVRFNFSASDNLDSNLSCNITVAGTVRDTNIPTVLGQNISRLISSLPDGTLYWNVTCVDDAGNFNTSESWSLNVSEPPTVQLNSPQNNYSQNYTDIVLYYTPTDNYGFSTCNLFLNGIYYQSNSSPVQNGVQNNFTLSGLGSGYYNWTVNCTDLVGNSVTASPTWRFTIDLVKPSIRLNAPSPGQVIYGTNITFNYTVFDDLDSWLLCNLTVDGINVLNNSLAQNGSDTIFSRIMEWDGVHWWNMTCIDDAGNWNISETRNFTSMQPPTIDLYNPVPDAVYDSGQNIVFRYVPYDRDGLNGSKLIINGVVNKTNESALDNGNDNYFYLNLTQDGVYYWSVNATDKNGLEGNSSTRKLTIDTTPPNVTYYYPTEGVVADWNNVTFNFTVFDALDNSLTCDLSINGEVIFPNFEAANSTPIILNWILTDGTYNWSVDCFDHASLYNAQVAINFTVDAPPRVVLNSPKGYRTNSRNITFNYTPYDAIGFENCSLYINDQYAANSSNIQENIPNYFNAYDLQDGDYNWTVLCIDENDLNPGWSDAGNFSIDNAGPHIALNSPSEGEGFNQNNITFNWTATDYAGTIIYCNMTLDGSQNQTDVHNISGIPMIVTVPGLVFGDHNWSVICVDDLGNTNTSVLGNFTINKPDLFISQGKAYLSNINPNLNENITIFANVTNIGGNPAYEVVVEFWDGLPGVGTLIGNDSRASMAVNGTYLFNITWAVTAGYHTLWIAVDPYNTISELNESNNNASIGISVLSSALNKPDNATWWSNESVELNFTLTDYTGGSIGYTIFVDGQANGQVGSVTDGIDKLLNVTLTEGMHRLRVQATDALGRRKNSSIVTVYVDLNAPVPRFQTRNQSWFNDTTPEIFFNITDSMDAMLNYTLYVNGGFEAKGNVSNATSASINLSERPEGVYVLVLEAFDDVMHRANSTELYIYIDTTPPSIRMDYPPEGYNFTSPVADLNFTVFDNMDEFLTCNLSVDNVVYRSSIEARNNTMINTSVSLPSEGIHYWNVTCVDNATNANTSQTGYFYTWIKPHIELIAPPDNNWTGIENQTFYFNVSDQTGLTNCSLLLGGIVNSTKTGGELVNGGISNISVNYLSGRYEWTIECYDNTSQLMYNNTGNRTLYVDVIAPYPYIMTQNASWFNSSGPSVQFNITDNLASTINYMFYVDGAINTNGSVSNSTPSYGNLTGLSEGAHQVIVEAYDLVYNRRNSSATTIYVDMTKPSINLTSPSDGFNSSVAYLDLKFIATDNLANNLTCNLMLDGSIPSPGLNLTNNTEMTVHVSSQAPGYHYWNVSCWDLAGNRNTSETRMFYIEVPDLYVNASGIMFNESDFIEDMSITVNATISNLGDGAAYNVTVQFFEGDWQNGSQINGNRTITELPSGGQATVNVSYITKMGTKWIYVVVDPPIASNGTIHESNESNNYVRKSIVVGSYELFTGNLTGLLELYDESNLSILTWNVSNYTHSNIFVADSDSMVMWTNLTSLGRDRSGLATTDDFEQADIALGMSNNTDSLNITWTSNQQPSQTADWMIYGQTIPYVPVVNSTNSSSFITGILWDSSDLNNGEFNGTQDLVFVTAANQNQQGRYGVYDYELRVPANLRKYLSPNNLNSVTMYVELK